jgi:hypothetical protein
MGHVTFLFRFLPACNDQNWEGKVLSAHGEKQNETISSGSNVRKLYVK